MHVAQTTRTTSMMTTPSLVHWIQYCTQGFGIDTLRFFFFFCSSLKKEKPRKDWMSPCTPQHRVSQWSESSAQRVGGSPVNPDFCYSHILGFGAKIVKFEIFSEFEAEHQRTSDLRVAPPSSSLLTMNRAISAKASFEIRYCTNQCAVHSFRFRLVWWLKRLWVPREWWQRESFKGIIYNVINMCWTDSFS